MPTKYELFLGPFVLTIVSYLIIVFASYKKRGDIFGMIPEIFNPKVLMVLPVLFVIFVISRIFIFIIAG
jgi:hypothetical protein